MEVIFRARQIGGDHARIALLSTVERTIRLENEIAQDLEMGKKIKVFGKDALADLTAEFDRWLTESS